MKEPGSAGFFIWLPFVLLLNFYKARLFACKKVCLVSQNIVFLIKSEFLVDKMYDLYTFYLTILL